MVFVFAVQTYSLRQPYHWCIWTVFFFNRQSCIISTLNWILLPSQIQLDCRPDPIEVNIFQFERNLIHNTALSIVWIPLLPSAPTWFSFHGFLREPPLLLYIARLFRVISSSFVTAAKSASNFSFLLCRNPYFLSISSNVWRTWTCKPWMLLDSL